MDEPDSTKLYRIVVRAISGAILTYNGVDYFEVVDGFVTFRDPRNKERVKRFSSSNTEIEEQQS